MLNQVPPKPMASRNRDRRGAFSLLELIIVLMVMIGLLAIAWPNLQRPLRRNSLSEAAQALQVALDESRYLAITTGSPMFVRLRQGASEIQAGTFESFANDDAMFGSTSTVGIEDTSSVAATSDRSLQLGQTFKVKSWSLPESVVIESVRWTLDAPVDAFDELDAVDSADPTNSSGALDASSTAETGRSSDASLGSDLGTSQTEWWLPLVATGQGRDAAIVLFDTAINEQITVSFASATGALEIER